MKPLHLRLQAFGPFANSITISFDRVFDGGLFLLHGRTGAGKTSILDGLCFALFGRPSTPEREKDLRALRSDAANADCQTEVELIFTIGTAAYRIKRIPTQEVPKKRGEGTTELKGAATLERWLGSIEDLRSEGGELWRPLAGSTKDVDLKVEELLGMNEKQFRQIVILPQGRFREFLSSTSTERQAILERLFQTDRFGRFQNWIASKAKSLETEWHQQASDEAARLEALGIANRSELETALVNIRAVIEALRPRLQEAQASAEQYRRRLLQAEHRDELQRQLSALTVRQERLTTAEESMTEQRLRLERYRRYAPLFQLENREQNLANQIAAVQTALAQLKTEHSRQLENENQLNAKLTQLEARRPTVDELEAERIQLQERYRELQDINKVTERIDLLTKEGLTADQQLQTEEQTLSQTRKRLHSILLELPRLHDIATTSESRRFEESLLALHSTEAQFHLGEAARLAQTLKKGAPCPVCGSEEHPSPAKAHLHEVIDKNTVEREQKRHHAVAMQIQKDQAVRNERLKTLLVHADSSDGKISHPSLAGTDFTEAAALATREVQALQASEQIIQKLRLTRAPLTAQIAELEAARTERLERIPKELQNPAAVVDRGRLVASQKTELESALRETKNMVLSLQTANAGRVGLLRGKEEELSRLSTERQALVAQIANFDHRERHLAENLSEQEVGSIEKALRDHDAVTLELRGKIEATRDTLKTISESEAIEKLRHLATTANEQQQLLEQENAAANERARLLHELKASTLGRDEVREALERRFKVAQKMNLLLSGDRSINTLSVPLARYVLQARFEACLEMANHRLLTMSRGQYQLRRPLLSRNLTHSQGLNLSVEDAHTGRERPADSLSGGESFIAALALALGLSDVVQTDLGGIRLDSLFIDEGFGTLDSESLELAIRTLVDLQAGGRMVGIISHVQELQSQLQHRLEIRKTPSATTATWADVGVS